MHVETTMNIRREVLDKITDAASSVNLSKSEIISIILVRFSKGCNNKSRIFSTVRYQQASSTRSFHRLHVVISNDIYEKCLDMRKLLKMSVSYILACAVEKYLEEIIKSSNEIKDKRITDNYYSNYIIISKYHDDGIYSYTIFWGFPNKKTLMKTLQ